MSANTFSPMLKTIACKVFPTGAGNVVRYAANGAGQWKTNPHLARLRWRLMTPKPRTSGYERCFGYTVHINDGPNFYILYKDIFIKRIYHFEAHRSVYKVIKQAFVFEVLPSASLPSLDGRLGVVARLLSWSTTKQKPL